MSVTAKFKVNRVSDMGWGTEVELTPDYATGRNSEWAAATPAGMIRLTIKSEARHHFTDGRPFTVTFTPEDEPETVEV